MGDVTDGVTKYLKNVIEYTVDRNCERRSGTKDPDQILPRDYYITTEALSI